VQNCQTLTFDAENNTADCPPATSDDCRSIVNVGGLLTPAVTTSTTPVTSPSSLSPSLSPRYLSPYSLSPVHVPSSSSGYGSSTHGGGLLTPDELPRGGTRHSDVASLQHAAAAALGPADVPYNDTSAERGEIPSDLGGRGISARPARISSELGGISGQPAGISSPADGISSRLSNIHSQPAGDAATDPGDNSTLPGSNPSHHCSRGICTDCGGISAVLDSSSDHQGVGVSSECAGIPSECAGIPGISSASSSSIPPCTLNIPLITTDLLDLDAPPSPHQPISSLLPLATGSRPMASLAVPRLSLSLDTASSTDADSSFCSTPGNSTPEVLSPGIFTPEGCQSPLFIPSGMFI